MRILFAALAISIACAPAVAQAPADAMYTQPGTLIPVGSQHLNFYCMGSGSPVVIMEGGFGDWSPAFSGLQQRVAAFTRVCSYDRAGYGFSDPGPMPRRVDRLAEELHTALHNGGIAGPYFFVGLAFGSLPARAFADRWMAEVAGLVLINGDAPDLEAPEMTDYWQRLIARRLPVLQRCRDRVAAGKPVPLVPPPDDPHLNCYASFFREGLPDPQFSPELNAALQDEIGKRLPIWDALVSELEQMPDDNAYLKEHRTSFGSRPVRILTASLFHDTPNTPSANRLEHMRVSYYEALAQAMLLNLSSNAKQIFSDTGPVVHFEKPELVTQTIREAWEQCK